MSYRRPSRAPGFSYCGWHRYFLTPSFKQRSGYASRRGPGQCLWQTGYDDHVLRDEQSMQATAGYILQHPVRAGLVERMEQYPHLGSDRWEVRDLLQAVARRQKGA
jgi:hypothetical protein